MGFKIEGCPGKVKMFMRTKLRFLILLIGSLKKINLSSAAAFHFTLFPFFLSSLLSILSTILFTI